MSQMNQYQQSQNTAKTKQVPFLEKWKWEGEDLELVYNPYDSARSQFRPDCSRLIGIQGGCKPVQMLDKNTGKPVLKYLLFAKVKDPAEPGSLVPDKFYRCWRFYDEYKDPRLVDWNTVIFYEIKTSAAENINEAQRFINAYLQACEGQQPAEQEETDTQWVEDFAMFQKASASRQEQMTSQPEESTDAAE